MTAIFLCAIAIFFIYLAVSYFVFKTTFDSAFYNAVLFAWIICISGFVIQYFVSNADSIKKSVNSKQPTAQEELNESNLFSDDYPTLKRGMFISYTNACKSAYLLGNEAVSERIVNVYILLLTSVKSKKSSGDDKYTKYAYDLNGGGYLDYKFVMDKEDLKNLKQKIISLRKQYGDVADQDLSDFALVPSLSTLDFCAG